MNQLRELMLSDEGLDGDRHQLVKERVMAAIQTERPPAEPQPTGRRRGLRRALIPALAAMVLLAVAGTAGALGLLPGGVLNVLQEADCRQAGSVEERVASSRAADGRTFELWTTRADAASAPNGHMVVELDEEGNYQGGTVACGPPNPQDPDFEYGNGALWASGSAEGSADHMLVTVIGRVPGPAIVAEVTLSDGSVTRIDVQTDGHFLGIVTGPGVDMDAPVFPEPVRIVGVASDGSVVADITYGITEVVEE